MAQASVQGEFSQENGALGQRVYLPGTEQHADGDGQVVGRALFFEVGGGQVHRDASQREFAVAVAEGSAHSFFGFLDRGVGKADDVECGESGGDIHFDLDHKSVQTDDRAGLSVG